MASARSCNVLLAQRAYFKDILELLDSGVRGDALEAAMKKRYPGHAGAGFQLHTTPRTPPGRPQGEAMSEARTSAASARIAAAAAPNGPASRSAPRRAGRRGPVCQAVSAAERPRTQGLICRA
jgi:hypothetical protein